MADAEGAELHTLTAFTAVVGRRRDRTTLDIHQVEGAPPTARLSKVGPPHKRAAYELFTGSGLATPAGTVTASGGVDADGRSFGIINLSDGVKSDTEIHPLSGGLRSYVSDPGPGHRGACRAGGAPGRHGDRLGSVPRHAESARPLISHNAQNPWLE